MQPGIGFRVEHRYTRPLLQRLPFPLTPAQKRVLGEIKADMMAPHPMNRLVQGDVGSGKTLVALMAALVAIENQCQVAVVAPTEILAEQHYRQFQRWLPPLGLKAALLCGSTGTRERREILQELSAGEIHLLAGTHAVLQDDVRFHRLGLGIIDEQHRFGVRQRAALRHKGENPDMLIMTATPIPRTLAMTAYGDLAISVIDELPPGRQPIRTRLFPESRRETAYQLLERELADGRQGYIVYPLVEESEKSDLRAAMEGAEHLRQGAFSHRRIGVLHGRLSGAEKEEVMRRFQAHEIDLLVATTVVEVGIDVPNATVIVIEHAERFGLAQLHQLRGRVGRGTHPSQCLLLATDGLGMEGTQRLQTLVETADGFRIAEADLRLRGPGEILGTRQSGLPEFRIASLTGDAVILEQARQAAQMLIDATDGHLPDEVAEELQARWQGRMSFAETG